MNREQKSLLMSFLLHGIVIVFICTVSSTITKPDLPVFIDLSVSATRGGPGKVSCWTSAGSPSPKPAGQQRDVSEKGRAVMPSEQKKTALLVADQAAKSTVEQKSPTAIFSHPKAETAVAGKTDGPGIPDAVGRANGSSNQGNSGSYSGVGGKPGISFSGGGISASESGGGGTSSEHLKSRYMQEHFAYIKDLIQRSISYPLRARKMGWTGRVVVSFIIHENGRVSNETVVASSGFDLLDNNVITTIRSVAPFPKPPVKAELRVPIIYRLD